MTVAVADVSSGVRNPSKGSRPGLWLVWWFAGTYDMEGVTDKVYTWYHVCSWNDKNQRQIERVNTHFQMEMVKRKFKLVRRLLLVPCKPNMKQCNPWCAFPKWHNNNQMAEKKVTKVSIVTKNAIKQKSSIAKIALLLWTKSKKQHWWQSPGKGMAWCLYLVGPRLNMVPLCLPLGLSSLLN